MIARFSLCFLAIVASATAISIGGLASLDANAFQAQGKLTFPRIPGINTPLFSSRLIMPRNEDVENVDSAEEAAGSRPAQFFFPGHHKYPHNIGNLANIVPVPNITALLMARNITNATNVIVLPLPPLPETNKFFHHDFVVYQARRNLAQFLNTTGDVTVGLQQALQQAFNSNDPASSINTLIRTILIVYGAAIQNCPFIFACARLATEAATLVRDVITAVMTATIVP